MNLSRGVFALLALTAGCLVLAQDRAVEAQEVVTRVYDLRALTVAAPDYPLRQRLQPNRDEDQRRSEQPAVERDNVVNDIIKLVTTTVAPESWREAGGRTGSISAMNGQLIVTQTMEHHQLLKSLLDQLQMSRERTIRIEATWLLLTAKEMETLQHPAGMESLSVVPEATMKSARVYARGQTLGFNTQQVHVASHAKRLYVSDLQPVVGTGSTAYQPTMSAVNSGVGLQVRPLLTDHNAVILDLFNEVLDVPAAENGGALQKLAESATTRPAGKLEYYDGTRSVYQTLRTTIRIPLGQPVVIGGVTLEPASGEKPARELYLVIKADADQPKKGGM